MPKTLIKILILLVAAGLVCFIVLLFYNTQMKIPEIKDFGNPHLNEIRKSRHAFDSMPLNKQAFILSKDDEIEERYYDIICMLDVFKNEGFLTDEEYRQQKDSFWTCYSNFFLSQCECLFSQDEWSSSQREFVKNKIKSLESFDEKDMHSNIVHKLDETAQTCKDYEDAENLIRNIEYYSLWSAKDRINKAAELKADGRLSNCNRLSSALANYPDSMGNACYNKITRLYDRLSNWRSYSMQSTLDTYETFCSLCNEYEGTSSGHLFGENHPKNISKLKTEALNYKNTACNTKCKLTVNNYSEECSSSWSSAAGECTYNVYTDHPNGYKVQGLSSWFRVKYYKKNSFTISYDKNSKTVERNDWFTVKAGNKKVKVNITQAEQKSANIHNVSMEQDVYVNGKKGMNVTVNFTANNCAGKMLKISLYYYLNSGTALRDYNGQYKTVTATGYYTPQQLFVSASKTIFMPYDELHMRKGKYTLKFNVIIWDGNTQLCRSSDYAFIY